MHATKAIPNIVLTYFNIQGVGEKVRLALTLGQVPFTDTRVPFPEWPAMKPTTPYGQLPLMTIDDEPPFAQSAAMLRYAGKLATANGCPLYPDEDFLKIEEAVGFVSDIQREWRIPVYIGLSPGALGHDPDADNSEVIKKVRTDFVSNTLPKYLTFLTAKLASSPYLCGSHPTIADCELIPVLNRMTCGQVDHVPTTCLDDFPQVKAYVARFMALEAVKAWYDSQQS